MWHTTKNSAFILVASSLFFLTAGEGFRNHSMLEAESPRRIVVRTVDLGSARVSAPSDLYRQYRDFYPALQEGIRILGDFFENPPLTAKPVYWLLQNEDQMKTILVQAIGEKDENSIRRALAEGMYSSGNNFAVILSSDVPRENLARLLFTRYAKTLIDSIDSSREPGSDWFAAGLSSYAGWMAEGEREKKKRADYEREIHAYYSALLPGGNPSLPDPVALQEGWSDSLRREPGTTYARAVLLYLKVVEGSNPSAGVAILKLMASGESFADAFQRGAGIPLADLGKKTNKSP